MTLLLIWKSSIKYISFIILYIILVFDDLTFLKNRLDCYTRKFKLSINIFYLEKKYLQIIIFMKGMI